MGTFGSDRVSAEDVSAAVAGAIRSGYRMFDCAACYGNEHEIGQVFKDAFDEGVVERKDLFIMTKVWNDMHRRVEEELPQASEWSYWKYQCNGSSVRLCGSLLYPLAISELPCTIL